MPHPAAGSTADPITLEPADDVVITTLVDNVYDALLTSDDTITRAPLAAGTAQAPQFEPGRTSTGLMAEHGFSALVTVRRGNTTTSVLFDTGLSPDAMVTNAGRLGLDLSGVHAVVLSHGHFDHAGGLAALAARRGTRSVPMILHPLVWTRRRLARPGGGADDWPTLSKRALTGEGFEVIERRQPSLLAGGSLLITGEVDRTTDFEHGMPPSHQHWTGTTWEPDPLILDDQALVVNEQGFAWLPEEDFVGHFAADVDPVRARVMWAVQQPLSASALQEVMGVPAWKSRPSWFLVAAGDQAIPPGAERQFAARMGRMVLFAAQQGRAAAAGPPVGVRRGLRPGRRRGGGRLRRHRGIRRRRPARLAGGQEPGRGRVGRGSPALPAAGNHPPVCRRAARRGRRRRGGRGGPLRALPVRGRDGCPAPDRPGPGTRNPSHCSCRRWTGPRPAPTRVCS
jgi:metal-dependent hydrolase (beta-lactamase superfamily II)